MEYLLGGFIIVFVVVLVIATLLDPRR